MPTHGPLVGMQIDQFKLVKPIGKGAMGTVYQAHDTILMRTVALKVIYKQAGIDAEEEGLEEDIGGTSALKRLHQEAVAAGRLSHPNIVTIYSYGETEELAYICMEYVSGKTLAEVLKERRSVPIEETVSVFEQILMALDAANQEQIVHRDIKPSNIMITNDGRVKVMDFGIAKISSLSMTRTGTILGTPFYMSPEQIYGHKVDIRSDIFSLGAMLYQVVTGAKPFEGDSWATVVYKVVHIEPIPAGQLNSHIPLPFCSVIDKALAKAPAARYQTPLEMLRDLKAALAYANEGSQNALDSDISSAETLCFERPELWHYAQVEQLPPPSLSDSKEKSADEALSPTSCGTGSSVEQQATAVESPPRAMEYNCEKKSKPLMWGAICSVLLLVLTMVAYNALRKVGETPKAVGPSAGETTIRSASKRVEEKPLTPHRTSDLPLKPSHKAEQSARAEDLSAPGKQIEQSPRPEEAVFSDLREGRLSVQPEPADAQGTLVPTHLEKSPVQIDSDEVQQSGGGNRDTIDAARLQAAPQESLSGAIMAESNLDPATDAPPATGQAHHQDREKSFEESPLVVALLPGKENLGALEPSPSTKTAPLEKLQESSATLEKLPPVTSTGIPSAPEQDEHTETALVVEPKFGKGPSPAAQPYNSPVGLPLAPVPSAAMQEEEQKRDRVAELLTKAEESYGQNRDGTSSDKTALDYYREAFALDKHNPKACEGALRLARMRMEAAADSAVSETAKAKSELEKASAALRVIPRSSEGSCKEEGANLNSELQSLRARITGIESAEKKALAERRRQKAREEQQAMRQKPRVSEEASRPDTRESNSRQTRESGPSIIKPSILKEDFR